MRNGTWSAVAVGIVAVGLTKTAELIAPKTSLMPCILDDDPGQLEMLTSLVASMGYEAIPTADPEQALKLIKRGRCRLALVDVHMPAMDGYEFLSQALQSDPGVHILLMTGDYTLDSALEAIRRGAADFLPKPIDRAHLKKTLDDAAKLYDQRRRVRVLEEQLLRDLEFHGIVGKSPAMLEVFDFARKVARHYTNVLLAGATGSGKELVARAIHQLSPVGQQKLAVCNCSALVDTLLESQLFGHMRGAFTGATDTRPGLFEYANGGTVFLDEVGEMSLAMQAKVLRVIQNREIQRVGSPEVRQVNVRLIAATNRDLRAEVLSGRFREDLFYRLSSIQIRIPSLAERLEDIPLLVQFLLHKYNAAYGKHIAGLTRRAQTVLLQHSWPGNVRELENVISSACITTAGDFVDLGDLPEHLQHRGPRGLNGDEWRPLSLEEVRKMHIQRVLEMCQGNRLRAAQILGIGRTSLYRYLKRDGYDTNKTKPGNVEA
ncbi:MAG: sigma-54-dependent Fis family transcriptional regulator [Acidobacteria bacterium]|nr:MAG: sigma-54-dependent Fis family transcriptional regulator [Acidobacteriota bacterium]